MRALAEDAVQGVEDEGHGWFDISTPAGWATILGLAGLAVLFLTMRRRTIVETAMAVFQFILVIAAAEMFIHYFARRESVNHPESPFWAGVGIDL